MAFIEENQGRPSTSVDEERGTRSWWEHQQKLVNAGALKGERVEIFKKLVAAGKQYRRVNQYQ